MVVHDNGDVHRTTTISVNGVAVEIPTGCTVADLLVERRIGFDGIAVAVDDLVIARSAWTETSLQGGETIEIIHAVQGG